MFTPLGRSATHTCEGLFCVFACVSNLCWDVSLKRCWKCDCTWLFTTLVRCAFTWGGLCVDSWYPHYSQEQQYRVDHPRSACSSQAMSSHRWSTTDKPQVCTKPDKQEHQTHKQARVNAVTQQMRAARCPHPNLSCSQKQYCTQMKSSIRAVPHEMFQPAYRK